MYVVVLTQITPNTALQTVVLLDQGGLFNDVESIVWVFNARDGFHTTTVEAWEASNSTALAGSDGTITHHAYLRSIGNTRLLFYTLFLASAAWASIHHPTECAVLKNAARRSLCGGMEGSQEGVGEPRDGAAGTGLHDGSHELQQSDSPSAYHEEEEDAAYAPVSLHNKECVALDAESEATVNGLGDDDEVIAFMPGEGMMIPDGPKRSVLCFLLNRNHRLAKRINDFAEEHKGCGQILIIPVLVVSLVALTEVIPLNLTWLGVLSMPDAARCLFKLNAQAVKLCISEPFDFLVPFIALTVGLIGAVGSLEFHPGCCAFFLSFGCFYVIGALLGKLINFYSSNF